MVLMKTEEREFQMGRKEFHRGDLYINFTWIEELVPMNSRKGNN